MCVSVVPNVTMKAPFLGAFNTSENPAQYDDTPPTHILTKRTAQKHRAAKMFHPLLNFSNKETPTVEGEELEERTGHFCVWKM